MAAGDANILRHHNVRYICGPSCLVSLGGRELRLENPALPVAVREADHIRWVFPSPVKVSTPGPDSSVREIRQYRDRIEFEVWPWASVRIEIVE